MKKKKICFAASSGGHFEQLMMLKPLMESYDSFILTEKTQYSSNNPVRTYHLLQVNRKERNYLLRLFFNAIRSLIIFVKERPDFVICTGVLSMIPICLLAKIFRKKLIYIESFAKVNSPTLSGKLLYKYADVFYVQWKEMLEIYPEAIYLGGIY